MSILDEIWASLGDELDRAAPAHACKTCNWLSRQNPDVVRDFNSYLDSGRPKSVLLRVCRRRGLDISESSLRRHVELHHEYRGK